MKYNFDYQDDADKMHIVACVTNAVDNSKRNADIYFEKLPTEDTLNWVEHTGHIMEISRHRVEPGKLYYMLRLYW